MVVLRPLVMVLAVLAAGLGHAQAAPAAEADGPGTVVVLEIKGAIGPATADYIERGLAKARERNASVVLLHMDTPGGLSTSMREIINATGELQAAQKLLDAANIMSANPQAMQLRYLNALHDIAGERTSTIVFPLPIDLVNALLPPPGDGQGGED